MEQRPPIRMTNQRRIILEEIRKVASHPTADEIFRTVRKRLPKISLATVYRNLEILSEFGMIRKLDLAGTQKRFDGYTENHYHVRCVECGRVDDVCLEPDPVIEQAAQGVTDYDVLSHRLEFLGVCAECKKKTEREFGRSKPPKNERTLSDAPN